MSQPVLAREFALDPDQLLWLRIFRRIDLAEWRLQFLDRHGRSRGFVYVGDALNDPERYDNIYRNKYYYWPTPPEQLLH